MVVAVMIAKLDSVAVVVAAMDVVVIQITVAKWFTLNL
jgi:hypothetical protein